MLSFLNRLKLEVAKNYLLKSLPRSLEFAVILGSGLSDDLSFIEEAIEIPFSRVPFLKTSKVSGHKNKIISGRVNERYGLFQLGRLHLYEGFSAFDVAFTVAIYGELGIKSIILTCASGGINKTFKVGDIVMISDHINLQGENVLIRFGNFPVFLDSSHLYDDSYYNLLKEKFGVKKGVYIGVKGPSYETPSEIVAFKKLGGDIIGMSTVQEVLMANYYRMKVIALSVVTNMAAGLQNSLSHQEVIETGKAAQKKLYEIIREILSK